MLLFLKKKMRELIAPETLAQIFFCACNLLFSFIPLKFRRTLTVIDYIFLTVMKYRYF